ncbi:hypothetical protein GQ44DRAFT_708785 [Phaeosphaeriaceae sp. PMI808]|nr:hypothetical protein GQ44DRAFT_708785 [Phaeosphaeriaceae sp. PMI808]
MKPSHSRLTCRAHNRFSPSTALWQYFVGAHRSFLHHRQHLSTTTTQAPTDGTSEQLHPARPKNETDLTQLDTDASREEARRTEPKVKISKVRTSKSPSYHSRIQASVVKNVQNLYDQRKISLKPPESLLARAREAFEAHQDYDGVVVQPIVNAVAIKESNLPWCLFKDERTMAGMDRLAIEIENFYEFAKPDYHETIARRHLIDQVRNDVRKNLPDYLLEVFGSERTGLGLATSDIDFRLLKPERNDLDPTLAKLPPPTHEQRVQGLQALRELYYGFFVKNCSYLLPQLRYARYPLVSLQDRKSGLDIQIVLANDTSLSRTIMAGYMEQYPYLRQLYQVVKTTLDIRGLTDVFRGGVGSYSLFMMIVASIRHNPHPRGDVAGALMNFLQFYHTFDTTNMGISIDPVSLLDKKEHPVITDTVRQKLMQGKANPLPAYMLSLRDPADETNDLGRKTIAIKHIQATFGKLYSDLQRDLNNNNRASLISTLVGSSYMLYKNRRDRLRLYGNTLLQKAKEGLAAKAKMIRDREVAEAADKTGGESVEGADLVKE